MPSHSPRTATLLATALTVQYCCSKQYCSANNTEQYCLRLSSAQVDPDDRLDEYPLVLDPPTRCPTSCSRPRGGAGRGRERGRGRGGGVPLQWCLLGRSLSPRDLLQAHAGEVTVYCHYVLSLYCHCSSCRSLPIVAMVSATHHSAYAALLTE